MHPKFVARLKDMRPRYIHKGSEEKTTEQWFPPDAFSDPCRTMFIKSMRSLANYAENVSPEWYNTIRYSTTNDDQYHVTLHIKSYLNPVLPPLDTNTMIRYQYHNHPYRGRRIQPGALEPSYVEHVTTNIILSQTSDNPIIGAINAPLLELLKHHYTIVYIQRYEKRFQVYLVDEEDTAYVEVTIERDLYHELASVDVKRMPDLPPVFCEGEQITHVLTDEEIEATRSLIDDIDEAKADLDAVNLSLVCTLDGFRFNVTEGEVNKVVEIPHFLTDDLETHLKPETIVRLAAIGCRRLRVVFFEECVYRDVLIAYVPPDDTP